MNILSGTLDFSEMGLWYACFLKSESCQPSCFILALLYSFVRSNTCMYRVCWSVVRVVLSQKKFHVAEREEM